MLSAQNGNRIFGRKMQFQQNENSNFGWKFCFTKLKIAFFTFSDAPTNIRKKCIALKAVISEIWINHTTYMKILNFVENENTFL